MIVKLDVWVSNTKSRRDKLTQEQRAALAAPGMDGAGALPAGRWTGRTPRGPGPSWQRPGSHAASRLRPWPGGLFIQSREPGSIVSGG